MRSGRVLGKGASVPWSQDVPSSQDIDAFTDQEAPLAWPARVFIGFHWRGRIDSILGHMLELSLQPSLLLGVQSSNFWLHLSGMANPSLEM